MKLVKCPRCDLNYIREDEKYCKVCLREMKGEPSLLGQCGRKGGYLGFQ